MRRFVKNKIDYLEEQLNFELSFSQESEGKISSNKFDMTDSEGNAITGIRKYLFFPLILISILIPFLIQLPFLLPYNIVMYIKSLIIGIPYNWLFILGPAKQVEIIDYKIKIEIRHNEHPPPHFHAIIEGMNYSFSILSGELLNGTIKKGKYKKAIEKWYYDNRAILIKVWNDTRPTDCSVGKIK